MNKIVIELCKEDRARLDAIIDGLAKVAAPAPVEAPALAPALRMEQAEDGTVKLVKPDDHPADAPITHLEPPAPAPEVKPVSLGAFQKAIVTRCAESPTVKEKVQALVHKYAESVSAIPEDKRHEVLEALAKI